MMLYFQNSSGFQNLAAAADEIEKLERLIEDIKLLLRTGAPSADQLEAAPLLAGWIPVEQSCLAFVGKVDAHPLLPGNRTIVTSPVEIMGDGLGWIRTHSRFYRLGECFGPPKDEH